MVVGIKETRQHTQRRHNNIYRIFENFTNRSSACKANDPPLELRRNELDQNYEENERSIKPMKVYLRRLEPRYMEEQKEIE